MATILKYLTMSSKLSLAQNLEYQRSSHILCSTEMKTVNRRLSGDWHSPGGSLSPTVDGRHQCEGNEFLREDKKIGQLKGYVPLLLVAIMQEGPKAPQGCQGAQALSINIIIQGLTT